MKSIALIIGLLLLPPVTSFALVDGFYSSVEELNLILKNASDIREKLGTAYRIEKIISREDKKGYLVTASTNRNQVCTLGIEVVRTLDHVNHMAPAKLSLKYGEVNCKPLAKPEEMEESEEAAKDAR